jgi:hypothetical protein
MPEPVTHLGPADDRRALNPEAVGASGGQNESDDELACSRIC